MKINLHTENDILGVLYVIKELKRIHEPEFAISNKNAYQKFEDYTQEYSQKISESTFLRVFNFLKIPKISYASMNKIVEWMTEGDYYVFTKYIEANHDEIVNSKLISKEKIQEITQKIENKTETKRETTNYSNTIQIKNLVSKKKTHIKIKSQNNINIEEIDSGEEIKIKINDRLEES